MSTAATRSAAVASAIRCDTLMTYATDIEFVFSECIRLKGLSREDWSKLSFMEVCASLPHPSGRGFVPCGMAAHERLNDVAELALSRSDYAGRIDKETVVRQLKDIIVARFLRESRDLDQMQADRAVSAALRAAAKNIRDVTHFVPCHLGLDGTPKEFAIGPVRFGNAQTVLSRLEPALDAHVERNSNDGGEKRKATMSDLLVDARAYYGSFGWIAEVDVKGCDSATSRKRAELMVQNALDCLHLLAGARPTKQMRVGGPAFSTDRRGKIHLTSDGHAEVSASVNWLSHPIGSDWWDKFANDEGQFVKLISVAIEAGNELPRPAPMAQRFLDAVAWFGEATRDPFSASRLVKYVTAIERILTIKNDADISETIATRGAAMALIIVSEDMESLRRRLKEVYNLRSRLVHGSRSPIEAGLARGLYDAERLTRLVLLGALAFYREEGLLAKQVSDAKLAASFDDLLGWANKKSEQHSEDA